MMASRQLGFRAWLGAPRQPRSVASRAVLLGRAYHQTPRLSASSKDGDGEEIKAWRSENTQSGYDQQAAEHKRGAFDPSITRPEEAKESVQRECNGSPLEFSGANKDISSTTDESTGGQDDHKRNESGTHPGKKHGKVKPT